MPDQNYQPTVQQVADHLQSRTRDKFGALQKTFNANTTPTDQDVNRIILQASTKVADEIGDQVPAAAIDDAADLVAIRAAMMIEMSYFSDQVETQRSPYNMLTAEYERELPRVLVAVQTAAEPNGGGVIGPEVGNRPSYSFPPVSDKITMDGIW